MEQNNLNKYSSRFDSTQHARTHRVSYKKIIETKSIEICSPSRLILAFGKVPCVLKKNLVKNAKFEKGPILHNYHINKSI